MPRQKKRRFVYTEHSDERIHDTVAAAIPEGGIFWDFLSAVGMEPITGINEWERGKCEGRRELAGDLLTMAMVESKKENTVKRNLNDAA